MASTVAPDAAGIEKMETGRESDDETPEHILEEFAEAFTELKAEWDKGKGRRDLNKIGQQLDQAKLLMAKLDAFLPKFGGTVGMVELTNIRSVLEIGAYFSLELPEPNVEQFVRYTAQLKNYYLDYSDMIPESPHRYELYCAKLLWLLTENSASDFHLDLALILYPSDQAKTILHRNPILFKTLKIAESLEDGRYNAFDRKMPAQGGVDSSTEQGKLALLEAQGDKAIHDSDICRYFLDKLVISYRPDIAETLERGYAHWPKKLALERLHFKSYQELDVFAAERNWVSKDGDNYTFEVEHHESMPARDLIRESLNYARDLDQII